MGAINSVGNDGFVEFTDKTNTRRYRNDTRIEFEDSRDRGLFSVVSTTRRGETRYACYGLAAYQGSCQTRDSDMTEEERDACKEVLLDSWEQYLRKAEGNEP